MSNLYNNYTEEHLARFNAACGPEHQMHSLEEFSAWMQDWEAEVRATGFGELEFGKTFIMVHGGMEELQRVANLKKEARSNDE